MIDAAVRNALIEALAEFSPEVVDEVLVRVDALPYNGDRDAYVKAITTVAAEVVTPVLQAQIDALQAETARQNARADALEAQMAKFERDFEKFRKMRTSDTIQ